MMIPRNHIGLSAPGIKHLTLSQFALKLITAGGLALTAALWWTGTTIHNQIGKIESNTQHILAATQQMVVTAKSEGIDLSNRAIGQIPNQVTFIKQVRDRVGFSWTQLLTDLESAVPEKVEMSAVSLDEKTNTVLLTGATQSLQTLNRLIHRLEKHPAFEDVILNQHANKKKKKTQAQRQIIFSMKVSYDPYHSKPETL